MILTYYGLKEPPFGVTPDPRYLFASPTHREALASLLYGIESGLGFITLTAMPGMGKTTLLFETLNKIKDKAVTAFIFQTIATPTDLLKALLSDLGSTDLNGGLVDLQLQLNEVLSRHSAEKKRVVLVIDEAQNLDDSVLEMVRMLSNFESPREKFLQIILSGQPQLAKRLNEPQLLQLRQRISISARLEPLSTEDIAAYIQHRLMIAGYRSEGPLFTAPAVDIIGRYSEGIPRNINNLCFNALTIGCAMKAFKIGPEIIREVIADLNLDQSRTEAALRTPPAQPKFEPLSQYAVEAKTDASVSRKWKIGAGAGAVVIALMIGIWQFGERSSRRPVDAADSSVATPTPSAAPVSASSSPMPAPSPSTSPTPSASQPAPEADSTTATADRNATADPVQTPPKKTSEYWVLAKPKQNLHAICTASYGICTPADFEGMLAVNSALPDPNRIKPGQKIFLPTPPTASTRANGVLR